MKTMRKLRILISIFILIIISVITICISNKKVNKIVSVYKTQKEAAVGIVGKSDSRFRYTMNEDGRTITIVGTTFTLDNYEENLVIPTTIDGYIVTKLDNIMIWGEPILGGGKVIKKLNIPSTVIEITGNSYNPSALESISVDMNNQYYSSEDGILFNKDKTKIIRYPNAKTNEIYTIPPTVTEIGTHSFWQCRNLTIINIPDSVKKIEYAAFDGCENLTIHCNQNSEAHKHAVKNSINFQFMGRYIKEISVSEPNDKFVHIARYRKVKWTIRYVG